MSILTTSQVLSYTKNLVIGEKGADAWKSTMYLLLDLFVISVKKCPEDFDEFTKIFQIVSEALKSDPDGFVKVLKFHRLIKNGNGIKWLYYLGMILIKIENPHLYEQILEWSWEYPKDLLILHRMTNMYEPIPSKGREFVNFNVQTHGPKGSIASKLYAFGRQNYIMYDGKNIIGEDILKLQYEIVYYANEVLNVFINLMTPGSTTPVNPMYLKYMEFETGHWAVETKLIWNHLEILIEYNQHFFNLINSSEQLTTPLWNGS